MNLGSEPPGIGQRGLSQNQKNLSLQGIAEPLNQLAVNVSDVRVGLHDIDLSRIHIKELEREKYYKKLVHSSSSNLGTT